MEHLSDQELLARYAKSVDQKAFRTLVDRHLQLIYQSAYRRLGDVQRSEDVCQQAFSLLARKAKTLQSHPAPLAWLHKTTHFLTRRLQRAEGRQALKARALADDMKIREQSPNEWTCESRSLLDEALATALKAQDRQVLLLHFVEGRSFREIAHLLEKSEAACRTQSSRALSKVSRWFQNRGYKVSATVVGSGLAQACAPDAFASMASTIMESLSDRDSLPILERVLAEPARLASTLCVTAMGCTLFAFTAQSRPHVHREMAASQAAPQQSLPLTRARRDESDLLSLLEWHPDEWTADALIRIGLEDMWTGKGGREWLLTLLSQSSRDRLLALLDEIDASPVPINLKNGAPGSVIQALAQRDPEFACDLALNRGLGLITAYRSWLRMHPVQAAHWLEGQDKEGTLETWGRASPMNRKSILIRIAAAALIRVDQEHAFALLERVEPQRRDAFLAHLGVTMIQNGVDPTEVYHYLKEKLTHTSSRELATRLIMHLADASLRDAGATIITSIYGNEPDILTASMLSLVEGVIDREGNYAQEARWLLENLPESAHPGAVQSLASRYASQGNAFNDWIATFPQDSILRDHALLGMVHHFSSRNPAQAKESLSQIQDTAVKGRAQDHLGRVFPLLNPKHQEWDLSEINLSIEP